MPRPSRPAVLRPAPSAKATSVAIVQVAPMRSPPSVTSRSGQPIVERSTRPVTAGCGSENSHVPPPEHLLAGREGEVGAAGGGAIAGDRVQVHDGEPIPPA